MKNNDFDFIKNKFDAAMPDVPDRLDESVLKYHILTKHGHKVIKFERTKKINVKLIIAAACFVLIFGMLATVNLFGSNAVKAESFKSYEELNTVVADLEKLTTNQAGGDSSIFQNFYSDADLSRKSSKTATDGKYIYYAYHNYNDSENKIYIYQAAGGDTRLANIMNDVTPSDDYEINALFISGKNLAAVITNEYETAVKLYDISNPENPILNKELVQDGVLINSYMLDGVAYFVSFYGVAQDGSDGFVPKSDELKVEPENIYRFENIRTVNYIVIGAVDVKSGKRAYDTKAILGSYSNTYITDGYLFVANDNAFFTDNSAEIEYIKYILKSGRAVFDKPEKLNIPIADSIETVVVKADNNLAFSIGPSEDLVNEIVLYDVTDNANPKVLDRKSCENIYGFADDVQTENGVYAFSAYYADTERRYYGVVTFEIKNNKIEIRDKFVNDDDNLMYQGECIIVGDYVYGFGQNDNAPDEKKITAYPYKY